MNTPDMLADPVRVPRATYRLQFHRGFTLQDALALVPFIEALGVSHVYASPLLKAIPEHSLGARRLSTLPGIVPGRYDRPHGCLLSPRCPYGQSNCVARRPTLDPHAHGAVRCFYPLNLIEVAR